MTVDKTASEPHSTQAADYNTMNTPQTSMLSQFNNLPPSTPSTSVPSIVPVSVTPQPHVNQDTAMALQTAVPEQFSDPPLLTSPINVPSALSTSAIPQSHLGHNSVMTIPGQFDYLPSCTPMTNVSSVLSESLHTSVSPQSHLDHDAEMTVLTTVPSQCDDPPSLTPMTNIHALPTYVVPQPHWMTYQFNDLLRTPATNLTPQPLHSPPMSPQYSAPTTTIPPIPIPQPLEQHLMTPHQFDDLPSHTPMRNILPTPVILQPLHLGSEEFTTTPQSHGADFIPMNPDMHMDAPTSWPLCIPTSLESIIQHTIMDWLSLNSIQIVESMVHGVVDACIPRLEELIDAKIASLSSKQTSKCSCPPSHIPLGSGDNGLEGDAELDEDEPPVSSPKGRKKAGPVVT